MKTVLIYDQVNAAPISFIVIEGDYRHLDGIYINVSDEEELVNELANLLYTKDGVEKFTSSSVFPHADVIGGAFVIVVGFA